MNAVSDLSRGLKGRHIQLIALGGTIGVGFFRFRRRHQKTAEGIVRKILMAAVMVLRHSESAGNCRDLGRRSPGQQETHDPELR